MLNITLNNNKIQVEKGTTILEAAQANGVNIPTLCHLDMASIKMVNKVGTCRVCMVEVEGRMDLMPACAVEVYDGMVIHTNTTRAIKARRTMVELFLSNHPKDCLVCERNRNCELQTLAADLNIRENRYEGNMINHPKDVSSQSLIRDAEKCVICRRCETMCNQVQTVGVYSAVQRGIESVVSTAFDNPMTETSCTFCGQCVSVCPTGALTQVSHTSEVWDAINDPEKVVIVQTAPAIRVALGEEFGYPIGTNVTGQMVAGLRRIGFNHVYDTVFAADLCVMEEATELIHRIKNGGRLPMLTSCCPAWVKFIEHQFPELLDVPSTCKSPQQMFGAIAKTYLAEKLGVDPANMVVVSIMPCLAKKFEAAREEHSNGNFPEVDYVLTTRELAAMLREAGVNFNKLPNEDFDKVMGEASGAGVIFGTTGGVIEAAVRTTAAWMGCEILPDNIEYQQLRGVEGIREATIKMCDLELKVGIANGLGNARTLLENIRDGKSKYDVIEIMACPGGCISGGGQPFYGNDREVIAKRAEGLYDDDRSKEVRHSHENAEIKALYAEFLGEPGGEKAHKLLHTSYTKRPKL